MDAKDILEAIRILDEQPVPVYNRRHTPMYTQKHYESLADLIHKRRLVIKKTDITLGTGPLQAHSEDVQIAALNDLVMDMVEMFKADNPKFRELIFIARCNRDLADK